MGRDLGLPLQTQTNVTALQLHDRYIMKCNATDNVKKGRPCRAVGKRMFSSAWNGLERLPCFLTVQKRINRECVEIVNCPGGGKEKRLRLKRLEYRSGET